MLQSHASHFSSQLCPGQSTSFSSPEFQQLLPQMDEKMRPIEDAKVPDEVCLKMVEALAAGNSYMKRPGIIHTGIILPEGLRLPIAISGTCAQDANKIEGFPSKMIIFGGGYKKPFQVLFGWCTKALGGQAGRST